MSTYDEQPDWTLEVPARVEWDKYELAEWRDRLADEWAADNPEDRQ